MLLFTVFKQFEGRKPTGADAISYTQFMEEAKQGRINKVEVQGRTLMVTPTDGKAYSLTSPGDLWMTTDLMKYGVNVYGAEE